MFSEDILIYPTDVHTIYDQSTGELLNLGKPITIGNHVWCNRDVKILKGSVVGNDVVIAANSLVNKSFFNDNNVILGGQPAKILKRNINWSRETPWEYLQKQNRQAL